MGRIWCKIFVHYADIVILFYSDSAWMFGQVGGHSGPSLTSLSKGQTIGLSVDNDDLSLHLYVDDVDHGVINHGVVAGDIYGAQCHVVVDLYGRCDRLSVVAESLSVHSSPLSVTEYQEKAAKENGN